MVVHLLQMPVAQLSHSPYPLPTQNTKTTKRGNAAQLTGRRLLLTGGPLVHDQSAAI